MSKPRHTAQDSLDREYHFSWSLTAFNLHRYAMAITTGATPSASLDTSFMDNLGLQGYVPASGRGTVSGSHSGILSGQPVTIGFKVM